MALRGEKAFTEYYAKVFGVRWPQLEAALRGEVKQVSRLNMFADAGTLTKHFPLTSRNEWRGVFWSDAPGEPQVDAKSKLLDSYRMDLASIFPPLTLNMRAGERVLDMCAAPGGKSLIIAEALLLKGPGDLIVNEVSDNRRARLVRVIKEYVPPSLAENIKVTNHDASRWCLYEKNAFDKILLDAPCSGERHLIQDLTEMRTWSEARTKNLAVRQYGLLASAIQTVKPGGRIVYSTCSLSVRENDEVIARLLKRRPGEAHVVNDPAPMGEATEHGWMILPDTSGFGPIYYSVLERI